MSDYRGRGRGRGGGRGGDRGGGGGFQGVGGGRGRGGGDFQGGGGGRGFHGGGRGRGRGGGGGRGDGRGQGDDGGPPVYLGSSGSIPTPEPEITKLEDDWIKKQTTSVGALGALGALSLSDAILPRRPQFGTRGVETVLWANYFRLKVNADSLWKYDVKVMPTKVTKAEQDAKDNKKREDKTPGGQPGDGAEGRNEVKGQKLAKIIQLALSRLPSEAVVATEYKQQVVSLKKLELPADNFIEVVLSEPPRKPETWFVRFDGPLSIDVSALMQYLQTLEDTAHETVFPKFPDEIDALGVVLGHTPRSDPSTTAVGRNRFFAFDSRRVDKALPVDKNFLEFLRGYVQSVRPATGRLLLNVNVTAGVFRRGFPLLAYLQNERINMKDWTDDAFDKAGLSKLHELHKVLARSRIRCKAFDEKKKSFTLSVERTVAGLARNGDGPSAREEKPRFRFPKIGYGTPWTVKFKFRAPKTPGAQPPPGLQFDTEMSVGQYFQARYGYIARADLPLVNVGTRVKPVYVPAEFCEVLPGQPLKTKLTAADQAAMINFACRSPGPNARSVTGKARLVLSLDNNNLLDKFHISVDRELITVKGRELAPPVISYQGGKKQSPANGGWNMRGVRVCKTGGKQQISWAFASLGSRRFQRQTVGDSFKRFVEFLRDNQGIPLDKNPVDPRGTHHEWYTEGEVHKMFKAIQGLKTRPNLVLIALEDKDTNAYTWVKKLGDVEFGFMTVCCRHDQLAKGSPAYIANVGLKVNLKFGGTNHLVTDSTGLVKDTMFVGYDVTHPTNLSAGASENAPSFVGMVASINADLAQWPAVAWENQSRVEQVGKDDQGQFVNNFKDRILLWQKHNGGKLPPNIVIFRDGVSEGQFRMVLNEELPQIRQACQVTYPKGQKQPKISLIVSVKRHQTRFYPTKPDNIHADSKSPKEGTVVDRGVTNVRYWDFFLQAHASLQGTARPAHYTVLLDEIFRERFKDKAASMLEQLTHDMCYAYNRATKAVSICPPAYYADLVCTRARIHKDELFHDEDVDSSTTSQQADRLTVSRRQVHPNLKDTMYYV